MACWATPGKNKQAFDVTVKNRVWQLRRVAKVTVCHQFYKRSRLCVGWNLLYFDFKKDTETNKARKCIFTVNTTSLKIGLTRARGLSDVWKGSNNAFLTWPDQVGEDDCDVFVCLFIHVALRECFFVWQKNADTVEKHATIRECRAAGNTSHTLWALVKRRTKKDGNTTKKSPNDGFWKLFVSKFKQGRRWSAFDSAKGENPLFTFVTSNPQPSCFPLVIKYKFRRKLFLVEECSFLLR